MYTRRAVYLYECSFCKRQRRTYDVKKIGFCKPCEWREVEIWGQKATVRAINKKGVHA